LPKGSLPYSGELFAGIIFLDIAGFTTITQTASLRGRYGVEIVTGVINHYFERINRIIKPHGGEIFKFGGDSCLILFPGIAPEDTDSLLSVSSAIEALRAELDKRFFRKYGFHFGLHGSLTRGNVRVNIVGDPARHLDYYVDGPAITRAYELAEGSQGIVIAPEISEPPIPLAQHQAPPKRASSRRFLPRTVEDRLSAGGNLSELRNAAVLFIKLSPAEGESLEVHEYDDLYRRIQRFVYRYEGVVNKIDYTEKGFLILVVFGTPVVHQDDIERAFLCATRISSFSSPAIGIRIGITYSNIYTGIIGATGRREYGILGNAVNIAARMMTYAENAQICLSKEIVPRISMKFETEFVTTTQVKGIKGDLEIHRLVRELPESWTQYRSRFESMPLCLSWEKTSLLNTAIDPLGECLVCVSGASGTGKSYVVWQLCERLRLLEREFHIFSADRFTRNMRLEFFYRALRKNLGIVSFVNQYDEFVLWCTERGIVFDRRMVFRFLQNPASASPAQASVDAEISRAVMYDVLAAIYKDTDSLIIDPLDNFDAESRALIVALARRNLAAGSVVIYTGSNEDNPFGDKYYHRVSLHLSDLDVAEASILINHYLPMVTGEAKDELLRVTSGNPRFLGELLRHIREVLKGETDLVTLQTVNGLQAKGLIPDRIENLLLADQQNLDPGEQQALRIASIYGMNFSEAELCRVFSLAEERFRRSLRELVRKGVIVVTELEPVPVYAIANPLLKESIYRTILLSDKIHLHQTVAEYYAVRYQAGETDLLELTARHYILTGKPELICHWAGILAEEYKAAGSYELAGSYFELLADNSCKPDERLYASLSNIGIKLSLADNASALSSLEELQEQIPPEGKLKDLYLSLWVRYYNNTASFDLMREFIAEHLGRVGDPQIRAGMRIDAMESLLRDNQIERFAAEALPLYQELEQSGDSAGMNTLSGIIAQFYSNQGDYDQAYRYYRRKEKIATRLKDPVGRRIANAGMGINLSRRGKKNEAIKYYHAALEIAEKSGDRNGYSKALLNIGTFLRNQGNYSAAMEHYQKSLLIAKHIGNLMQESIIIYDIGELLAYLEKHDESIHYFYESLAIAERIGDDNGKSFCYDAIGDNLFKHDKFAEAKAIYEQNLELQIRINDREGIAHTYGNLGNIAKMDKDWDKARELYHKQLDILSEVGDLDGSGRAWFNLAMIDVEAGSQQDAIPKLEKALELFTACDASYYIDITNQQLSALRS